MSFTKDTIHLLKDKHMSVTEITSSTGLSMNYVRTQLRLMEESKIIERVDNRTPIIYKLVPGNPLIDLEEKVQKAKLDLMDPSRIKEGSNFVIEYLNKYPKSTWPAAIRMLTVISAALKELEDEGKLVDTL